MSKENDKIFRILEHIAITFDKLGYSPTIPIFKGHQDFEWLFKLELDTIKALCNQQDQRIAELEEQLSNAIVPKFKIGQEVWWVSSQTQIKPVKVIIGDISYYSYRKHKFLYDGDMKLNFYEGLPECQLFATYEEAQSKLEELKNG